MNKSTHKAQISLSQDELDMVISALHHKSNDIAFTCHVQDEDAWATYREMTALHTRLYKTRLTHPLFQSN